MSQADRLSFPAGFIFGVSGGSLQSEGAAEYSDWIIHERKGNAPPSGEGSRKKERFDEDCLRAAELGIDRQLICLDWARLEPQRGMYDREVIDDYRFRLESARRRGLSIWITLHDVGLPAWFARAGGFMDQAALMHWHRFVELAAKEFGKSVEFWLPIRRPTAYALASELLGLYPPARKRMDKFSDMLVMIHRAHGDAYKILKAYLPATARVGMNLLAIPTHPHDPESDQDRISADFLDGYLNHAPLEALAHGSMNVPGKGCVELPSTRGAADFIGIDYFFRAVVGNGQKPSDTRCMAELSEMEGMPGVRLDRENERTSEAGFGVFPEGIYEAIKRVHSSGANLPMYVTGCGVATSDEELRTQYLGRTLIEIHRAIEQGLEVKGLFYWSDVDSYELNLGYKAHYGLFGFDPETGERTKRPAADLLARVIKNKREER